MTQTARLRDTRLPERFWRKVHASRGCWRWTGGLSDGYGLFWWEGRTVSAHRLLWQTVYGPVPPGLELDHVCRRRDCVRPDHLRAVEHRVNVFAGQHFTAKNARKAACPRGHAYATRTHKGRTQRYCPTCARASMRRAHRRRQQAARLRALGQTAPGAACPVCERLW